jgi:phage portal protein BeeE
MANIFTKVYDLMNASLDSRINTLQKTDIPVDDLLKAQREDGTYTRKGLIFDPFAENTFQGTGLYKAKASFLSNDILKQVSRRDPIVVSAIDMRSSQAAQACKRPNDRYDTGFKIVTKDMTKESDPEEVRALEEFILNCGLNTDRSHEDKLTFDQFGYMITQDMMRYGHCAVERIKRADGKLHSFLPLDAGSIFYANKNMDKALVDKFRDVYANQNEQNKKIVESAANGDYEFVQVVNGKCVEGFTQEELIFARFSLETSIDLNGYSIGPVEKAISAISDHLKVENHQRQFFTHGFASKGLLVLQGDVTPNALRGLQAQWNQQVAGPTSAWRTPILSGIQGVQWVPLSPGNRDMEYSAYQDYLLRLICSCMGISAEEIGFDYLSRGTDQKTLSESSNEWKLTAARDRGLKPLLTRIAAMVNEEIIPAYSKEISEKYHFIFVGLDAETRGEELQRLQAETQLHTSLNEAREEAEKEPMEIGGGLILNPLLIQTLRTSMPFGLWCEKFLGLQGYSERPDLQFIDNPSWFSWQQMQQQMMMQQAQGQMAAGPDEDEEEDDAPKKKSPPKKGDDKEEGDDAAMEQQQQAEQQAAQAQGMAIQQYIASNPQLFKSMNANLDLAKSQGIQKKLNTLHVEKMSEDLVKEWRKSSEALVKEILEVVKDDLKEGK